MHKNTHIYICTRMQLDTIKSTIKQYLKYKLTIPKKMQIAHITHKNHTKIQETQNIHTTHKHKIHKIQYIYKYKMHNINIYKYI